MRYCFRNAMTLEMGYPGRRRRGRWRAGEKTPLQSPSQINVFLGKNFDNVAKVGGEDFGLDVFEPQFQTSYGDWQTAMAVGTGYEVRLTLTDTTYAKDIFYFCHVHNAMSGRVKVVLERRPQK